MANIRIRHIGGKDIDGGRGENLTFTRENYFELEGIPLPIFLVSRYIPRRNSIHPIYPWYIAEDSRITNNIEKAGGRGITVATSYRTLKTNETNNDDDDDDQIINANFPWLLPAQDYQVGPIQLEESLDCLYRFGKWDETDQRDYLNTHVYEDDNGDLQWDTKDNNWKKEDREDKEVERWRKKPFETTAGTKLTGSRTRTIRSVSFWYYALGSWFLEEDIDNFSETINDRKIVIAGKEYKRGQVQISNISAEPDKWEQMDGTRFSLWRVQMQLKVDATTWNRDYENVSQHFQSFPYIWKHNPEATQEKPRRWLLDIDEKTNQPRYNEEGNPSRERIFHTIYDPDPEVEGSKESPYFTQNPANMVQFFGTREDCMRLNPDVDPTEVSEQMYLDKKGMIVWPNPKTGMIDSVLSPKVSGFPFKPMDFSILRMPKTR